MKLAGTMKLVEVATRRRVAISMAAVTLVLFGLIALQDLKVNLLPDLSYPTVTVRTEYRGAAPEEIETLLTRPVEEAVGVVRNVRSVKSVSRAGQSDVILEFAWGTNMDRAGLDVREKLEVLQLPLESSRPLLLRFNPATDPIMRFGLVSENSEEASLKSLRRFADEEIKKLLEPVEGVAAVKISGGLEDEIQIEIDQRKMAQLKLSLDTLSARLAAENVNVSAGRLEEGSQRYLVRTINQFGSVEEFGELIVAPGEGRPVYLRDIAHIRAGYSEREAIIRMNGQEAVEVAIYKEGDANTVSVAQGVTERLEKLADDLPPGMTIEKVDDQSIFIERAISEVVIAAILGGLLAVLVIFLFLRNIWYTFTIAISIPVSIIATFFLMGQAGISLNIMSLGGIALATGLLVDNAIVVLENISRYRAQGEGLVNAAIKGASEVGGAVIAATLTTIAVFLPLAFVDGIAGQLFRDQALTVTFALAVSLTIAVTLIPMMASAGGHKSLAHSAAAGEKNNGPGDRFGNWFSVRYSRVLEWALNHRFLTLATASVLLVFSVLMLSTVGTELVPQLDQGRFNVTLEAAPGTPLEETDRIAGNLQRLAAGDPNVSTIYGVAGSGNRIDANPTESGENIARMLVVMNPAASRQDQRRAIRDLRASALDIAGLDANFSSPELLSFDKPLEIEILGYDLNSLRAASDEVLRRLRQSDRFADVESSLERGHPEVQIFFDQERAAALGLTVKEISDQVVGKIRGQVATRYSWRDRKIDVLVRLSEEERQSIAAVRELIVNPQSEHPVPLSAVAEIRVAEGPAEIRRGNQERMALVQANLASGDLGSAVEEAETLLADMQLPYGLSMSITGQSEEMEASFKSLLFALGLAIFLVYLVMASQFESLLHPFVILFSIPLAAVGVALALWLTGTSLSVIVFIGLIMLAGIVVNNAIVLLDLINQLRERGMDRISAIREGARLRLRPIMMTTLTTVLGLLPMALGLGEGSEMRTPMAITVIGGLLTSTMLTLLVVPVMYSLLDRRRDTAAVEGANENTEQLPGPGTQTRSAAAGA